MVKGMKLNYVSQILQQRLSVRNLILRKLQFAIHSLGILVLKFIMKFVKH